MDRVILRLLAKEQEARFQSAREVLDALGAPAAALQARRADPAPSIAVLPFRTVSERADNEYFADGMTEAIIDALAQLPGLRVAARISSFAFKGRTADIVTVASELSVAHVLSGSFRRAGDRLHLQSDQSPRPGSIEVRTRRL